MGKRGYRTIRLDLPKAKATAAIRASARVADALDEIAEDIGLYHGVRLLQVLEAVYVQGQKDGARRAFEQIDANVQAAKAAIPHRSVGRPRQKRRS